ncbi:hypothetical protein [Streptomyces sp. NPDC001020]
MNAERVAGHAAAGPTDEQLIALVTEFEAVVEAVAPGRMMMPMPTPEPREIVSFAAADPDDPRSGDELLDMIVALMRERGWTVDESDRKTGETSVYAVREGLGGGFINCDSGPVSFVGFAEGSRLYADHVAPGARS